MLGIAAGAGRLGWSRFAAVVDVTLLGLVLAWGMVDLWSAVRSGQSSELFAPLPVSLLWVASLFLLLNVSNCGAGLQNN